MNLFYLLIFFNKLDLRHGDELKCEVPTPNQVQEYPKMEPKLDGMEIGLININTMTDDKNIQMSKFTQNFHILNFIELNIKNQQQLNITTSDSDYTWYVIPKQNFINKNNENQQHDQRIGFRIHNSISHLYNIQIKEYKYFLQDTRSNNQIDPCTVQTLLYSVQYKNKIFNNLIVYRTPDANPVNTLALYNYMNLCNPYFTLGDFNLDFKQKKFKKYILEHTQLNQIVKKPTRVQTVKRTTGSTTSSTTIDHCYIRKSLAQDCKYFVLDFVDPDFPDIKLTDHKLVKLVYNIPSPSVTLRIPRTLDPNRRYLPRGGVDWSSIICTFDPEIYKLSNVDEYYKALVDNILATCNLHDIKQRKSLPPKKIFRFTMSMETRIAKQEFNLASKYKSECKKYLNNLMEAHAEVSFYNNDHASYMPDIISARNHFKNVEIEYKKLRSKRNKLVNRDKSNFFATKFKSDPNHPTFLWNLVNRSKGKINKTVENLNGLEHIQYRAGNMAYYFHERSKIGLEDPSEYNVFGDYDPIFDHQFAPPENLDCYNIDIKIDDKIIDDVMNYKPSPHPDPDTLSMMIWHHLYTKNPGYRFAIRTLFYKCLHQENQIPGLELHDVRLFLKTDVVTRQKDLRPVADLTSLPKRMLKITVTQIKKEQKEVFYDKNDFSQPGGGAQASVITCYEECERGYFGLTCKPKYGPNGIRVSVSFYDSSNAFCTYKREFMIENLQLSGSARQILCRSIVRQNQFRVKTNIETSGPVTTTTGSPQGQPSSSETYSSIGKTMRVDPCRDIEPTCFVGRQQYVDDKFDRVISSVKNHQKIIDRNLEKLKKDCAASGECLNEEKTVYFQIGVSPPQDERMLGMIANTNLNSHSEIGPTLDRLNKVVCTTRACSTLTKPQKMEISRLQVHSAIFNFLFIIIYASPAPLEEFRKRINIAFKKSAQLPMTTSSVFVENYLYGMTFPDYCTLRIHRFCIKQINRGNSIFNDIEIRGNAGTIRNTRWQNKIGKPIGTLVRRYCYILNNFSPEYIDNLTKNKKVNKKINFKNCITFRPNYGI